MNLYDTSGTLSPASPFDFDKSLEFLGHFRPAMGEQDIENRTLTKILSISGRPILFRVHSSGSSEAPQLSYTLFSDAPISDMLHEATRERISFFLSIHDDLRSFYELGEADPDFAPIIQQLYGYHQVKFPSPFENACWAVLSQRNLMNVAHSMKDRLTEQFGISLTLEGKTYRAFPEPFQLAMPTTDDLNIAIRNGRKSDCISAVARAFDSVDEGWLHSAPYDEVEAWLLNIKGIGAWSAAFVLLRGLGRGERVPPDEKRLLEAARKIYGRDTLTHDDVQRMGKAYGNQRGYSAHYLRAAG